MSRRLKAKPSTSDIARGARCPGARIRAALRAAERVVSFAGTGVQKLRDVALRPCVPIDINWLNMRPSCRPGALSSLRHFIDT